MNITKSLDVTIKINDFGYYFCGNRCPFKSESYDTIDSRYCTECRCTLFNEDLDKEKFPRHRTQKCLDLFK